MMRSRWPDTGMMVKARSLGSVGSAGVSSGTGRVEFQISWKSAPTSGPCIGWCCGGGPSASTTDLPLWSCPVTTRRGAIILRLAHGVRIQVQHRLVLRHAVPVLGDLAVLDAEQVEVRARVLLAGVLRIRVVGDARPQNLVPLGPDGDPGGRDGGLNGL